MEGQWPVAINEDEEVDWGPQPHDEGATDGGGIQGCLMCQQGQNADNSQHNNDDTSSAQMPAHMVQHTSHAPARYSMKTASISMPMPGEVNN